MAWEPDYVAVAGTDGLAAFVRGDETDPWLGQLGTAAARAVDAYCNRQFGNITTLTALTYSAHNAARTRDGRWHLPVEDVQDITGATLTVDGTTVAAGVDGYLWWERNAVAFGRPYTALSLKDAPYGDVVLTVKPGWTAVPAAVKSAVRLQVNRWYVRRESPYGTAGSPQEGSEVRLTAVLDPDVRALLSGGRVIRKRLPR